MYVLTDSGDEEHDLMVKVLALGQLSSLVNLNLYSNALMRAGQSAYSIRLGQSAVSLI